MACGIEGKCVRISPLYCEISVCIFTAAENANGGNCSLEEK